MKLSKELLKLMNEQIVHEFIASNQYLQIATYFDAQALSKLSAFFYKQSDEERDQGQHARRRNTAASVFTTVVCSPETTFVQHHEVEAVVQQQSENRSRDMSAR